MLAVVVLLVAAFCWSADGQMDLFAAAAKGQSQLSCKNFKGHSVENLDLQKMTGTWYPISTSREPETRSCAVLDFDYPAKNILRYTFMLEQGEQVSDNLTWSNGQFETRFNDRKMFILTAKYDRTFISYYCKVDSSDLVREWYTVYSRSVNEIPELFTNNNEELNKIAGHKIKLHKIVQEKCPIRGAQLDDIELQQAQAFTKFGVWDLRLYSANTQPFEYLVTFPRDEYQKSYELKDTQLINEYSSYVLSDYRRFQKLMHDDHRIVKSDVLYFDGDFIVLYDYCIKTKQDMLKLLEKRNVTKGIRSGKQCTDILQKIKPTALNKVAHLLKSLTLIPSVNVQLVHKPKRKKPDPKKALRLGESDIHPFDFNKYVGVFYLKLTSGENYYDHQVQFPFQDGMKMFRFLGSKYLFNSTLTHIPNSKFVQTDRAGEKFRLGLVYDDGRYSVVYSICEHLKIENIRLYEQVFEGQTENREIEFYVQLLSKIDQKTMAKLSGLMSNLTTVVS